MSNAADMKRAVGLVDLVAMAVADAVREIFSEKIDALNAKVTHLTVEVEQLRARAPLRGEKGNTGESGPRGLQGVTGDAGPTGPEGPRGEGGDTGPPGARGEAGPPGPIGERGPPGHDGVDGKDGGVGPQGIQGERGAVGERGPPGADGAAGKDGAVGAPGERGEQGLIGPQGPPGRDGAAGAAGKDGAVGERGEPGEPGPRGIVGEQGPPGKDGASGKDGEVGPRGERGEIGPAGPVGRDGAAGRDAHYVRPVPWNVGTHARGAVVQHAGGLWEAYAPTNAEPGAALSAWSLIQDGIRSIRVEAEDDAFVLVFDWASGIEVRQAFWRPPNYAGVWDVDESYGENDLVTHDGSLWWALRTNKAERPGTPPLTIAGKTHAAAWRLVVKHGKDGKDGRDGHDGKDGCDGGAGQDGINGRDGATGETGPAGPAGAAGKDGQSIRIRGEYAEHIRYTCGDIVRVGSALYAAQEDGLLSAPNRAAGKTHWALLFDIARVVRGG